MLQKLQSLFPTKPVPAPIAQPTIQEKVSKAFQGIRESLGSLCCIKPAPKKVVVQKPSTAKVIQSAFKNAAQFAKTHKKALIGIATVGAVGAAAYNWNAIDLLRSSPDNIPAQRLPILTHTQIFSGIGVLASIGVGSRFFKKKQPVEKQQARLRAQQARLLLQEARRRLQQQPVVRLKDKLTNQIEAFNKLPIDERVNQLAVLDRDERLAMLHMIDPQGKNIQLRNMLQAKLQQE